MGERILLGLDELQLRKQAQDNEALNCYNERCIKKIYLLGNWPIYIGNSHTNECIHSDSYIRQLFNDSEILSHIVTSNPGNCIEPKAL